MNKAILIGRLTKDIELKKTQSGTSVTSFTVAVNRTYQSQDSNQPTADFINCVAWNRTAELMAQYVGKGSQVAIEGRIQTRNYENQQGQRVYVTEVVVDNFSLLESRAESEARRSHNGSNNTNNFGGGQQRSQGNFNSSASQNPFGAPASSGNVFNGSSASSQSSNDPFSGGQEIDISDDDLPF